jgi:hypothetical protein
MSEDNSPVWQESSSRGRRIGLTIWRQIPILLLVLTTTLGALAALRQRSQAQSATPAPLPDRQPRITIDWDVTFQTMTGWEATAEAGQEDSPGFALYRDALFDAAVDDLGIDRLRLAIRSGIEGAQDDWALQRNGRIDAARWRAVRYSTVNDNADPSRLNEAGFWFSQVDNTIETIVLPMKRRLEARGRRLHLNATYTAFTKQIDPRLDYHHADPEEYAEFVEATYRHLRSKYGLTPDSWEMVLEPDLSPQWSPPVLRQAMVAAGRRLSAMGITPRFIAPSTTSMGAAVSYADELARGGLPPFWSELSYHRYTGVSTDALAGLAARATKWNISTAMLEHIGSGYENLHEDLKTGQASAWQQFTLAFPTRDNGAQYYTVNQADGAPPRVDIARRTQFLKQYFRYIRTGAVRVGTATTDPAFDPLAFINPDRSRVVVIKASSSGEFGIQGLPAGQYEVTSTTRRAADMRVGSFTIEDGDILRASIAGSGVLTVFQQ